MSEYSIDIIDVSALELTTAAVILLFSFYFPAKIQPPPTFKNLETFVPAFGADH